MECSWPLEEEVMRRYSSWKASTQRSASVDGSSERVEKLQQIVEAEVVGREQRTENVEQQEDHADWAGREEFR